jgi:hypothetical protein
MEINRKQAMARHRWEWGRIVLKAKVHNRLYCLRNKRISI